MQNVKILNVTQAKNSLFFRKENISEVNVKVSISPSFSMWVFEAFLYFKFFVKSCLNWQQQDINDHRTECSVSALFFNKFVYTKT